MIARKILIVHPRLDVIGGAELVALKILRWILSNKNVDVVLLTLKPVEWERVERLSGMKLPTQRVRNVVVRCPLLPSQHDGRFTLLRHAFLHRKARRFASECDLCISTSGEIDFHRRGFQYIHYPAFAAKDLLAKYLISGRPALLDRFKAAAFLYRTVVFLVSGDRIDGFRANITAVNSEFMKDIVKESYNIESTVLYPAFDITSRDHGLPWEKRRFQFVAVGRIAPDKGYALLLDVFAHLSRQFPEARFVILGRRSDLKYEEILRKRVIAESIPVTFEINADYEKVRCVLAESKFFVHAREFEHFGIAVLEAAAAGCIPFVHNSGGQREIVPIPMLRYQHPQEVVSSVERILNNPDIRDTVLMQMQNVVEGFKGDSFDDNLERLLSGVSSFEQKD